MKLVKRLIQPTHILPLAIYRMVFGFLMAGSLVRFMLKGWVEACFLEPEFHFTYQYFDWIQPLDSSLGMYALVGLCAFFALCIGVGFIYRIASVSFFIMFTYLELIEQSWYLNHYYFVSIVAFLLCFVPANKNYSLDAKWIVSLRSSTVPFWSIFILKLQISIVYFFAGITKLKPDWLLEALPLKIWLQTKTDLPLIGSLFQYETTAYIFSYSGLIYDLLIPFLLWNKRTRPFAFIAVLIFHSMTALLFNIGMFPWIMIAGSLIFITTDEWSWALKKINVKLKITSVKKKIKIKNFGLFFFLVFFSLQVYLPIRHNFYSENVLWTERNYRFSWNVMLMEKSGHADFTIKDRSTGKQWKEYPKDHLTNIQEKQMSFQPDMIWQYAKFLKEKYQKLGCRNIEIFTDAYVTLNGRPSRQFLPKDLNLTSIERDKIYNFILREK